MEVRINREIREYTESMFFGLTMRQFIFTCLAIAASIFSYFLLKPLIGIEAVSWVCMLAAVPFAVLGFVRYNGMSAEKFIWAWIKSELFIPKKLCYGNNNMYWVLMHEMEDEKTARKQKKKKAGRKHRK